VTFHELRHSGATLLGDEHLKALQQRLGHSSSSTTADIYLTLPVAAQKPLADRLDALFGPQDPASNEGTHEGIESKNGASTKK
jgi:integrase